MNLENIRGSYDLFVSLGNWCGPSLNLRRHQLRRFSFPLDWSISNSLSDVNHLLKGNFKGFMELKNMEKIEGIAHFLDDGDAIFPNEGGNSPINAHFIKDNYSNVISVHDFPITIHDWKVNYLSYKEKMNNSINRFYEKLKESSSTLFIRWGNANEQEMFQLQSILSNIVSGTFKVIMLVPTDNIDDIKNIPTDLPYICSVQFPSDRPNDDALWDKVLIGMSVTEFFS